MGKYLCMAGVNFGVEGVTKRECIALGFENVRAEDGRVYFETDAAGILKANIYLRTAERVYLVLKQFPALTFEELFQGVRSIPWEEILPEDANFIVAGRSVKSRLFSISDCQRITEKALITALQRKYRKEYFEKSGNRFGVEVSLLKDEATITLDTSGPGLHKRGYREKTVRAPITETLGAAMVMLSFWNPDRILADPFCGSGTIPIEAAMIARNIPPGLGRSFDYEKFGFLTRQEIRDIKGEAYGACDFDRKLEIYASDINHQAIKIARGNAEVLGLEEDIRFFQKDVAQVDYPGDYGVLITNPPYGERMGSEAEAGELLSELGRLYRDLKTWSFYVVTSYKGFSKRFGKPQDRVRRLYNGRIEVGYYQYYGPRPPKKG